MRFAGLAGRSARAGIAAVSAGTLFPRGSWEGRILSLHEGAANLLHESGLVLSLVTRSDSMTDLSIEVALSAGAGSLGSLFERGARAAGNGDSLALGDLSIDLTAAPLWSGALSTRSLGGRARRPPRLALDEAASHLELAVSETAREEGLAELVRHPEGVNSFSRRLAGALASLELRGLAASGRPPAAHPFPGAAEQRPTVAGRRKISRRSWSAEIHGLSRIVGLGIGLTPSGDDFLSGAFLGERIARLARTGSRPLRIDRAEIAAALASTSPAGRTLLWLALRDSFPAYLVELARAVVSARSQEEVLRAVTRAAAHGETSGSDACTGLWWYLSLLASRGPAGFPAARRRFSAPRRRPLRLGGAVGRVAPQLRG